MRILISRKQVLPITAAILAVFVSTNLHAAQIRIEFSGVFTECQGAACPGSSQDSLLESLLDTEFSGVIEIPDAENQGPPELDTVDFPSLAERGLYTFNAPSFFSITTVASEFSLFSRRPVNVIVQKCIDSLCPPVKDFVQIYIIDGDFSYDIKLSAPPSPFETVLIPSLIVTNEY